MKDLIDELKRYSENMGSRVTLEEVQMHRSSRLGHRRKGPLQFAAIALAAFGTTGLAIGLVALLARTGPDSQIRLTDTGIDSATSDSAGSSQPIDQASTATTTTLEQPLTTQHRITLLDGSVLLVTLPKTQRLGEPQIDRWAWIEWNDAELGQESRIIRFVDQAAIEATATYAEGLLGNAEGLGNEVLRDRVISRFSQESPDGVFEHLILGVEATSGTAVMWMGYVDQVRNPERLSSSINIAQAGGEAVLVLTDPLDLATAHVRMTFESATTVTISNVGCAPVSPPAESDTITHVGWCDLNNTVAVEVDGDPQDVADIRAVWQLARGD